MGVSAILIQATSVELIFSARKAICGGSGQVS
jgi:hypothetical protein